MIPVLGADQTVADPRAGIMQLVGMMVIMVILFYFALLRPQQKKQKEHDALMKTLKPKDEVVTNSGIVGVIVSIKERTITLRSEDAKLEVLRSSVSEVLKRTAESA